MVTCSCFPSSSSLSSSRDATHRSFLLVILFFSPTCCYPQLTLLVYLVATFLLDFPQKWDLSVACHLGPQARLAAILPLCTFLSALLWWPPVRPLLTAFCSCSTVNASYPGRRCPEQRAHQPEVVLATELLYPPIETKTAQCEQCR